MGGSSSSKTNPVQPVTPSRRSGDGDRGQQGQRAAGASVEAAVRETAKVVGVVGGVAGGVVGGVAGAAAAGTVGTLAVAGATTGAAAGAVAGATAGAVFAFPVVAGLVVAAGVTGLKKSIARRKGELRNVQPRTRSNSFQWLPPYMSELRVVLLGNSWSERSSVGNFILGETKFNTKKKPDQCLRVRGELKEKKIVLINTPDLLHPWSSLLHPWSSLLHPWSSHERLNVSSCKILSSPGPHVFLLVIQPEDFTSMDELRLCSFLRLFSDQSFDHSLVLISTPREEQSGFMDRYLQHPPLKEMIKKCKYRFLWRKNLELPELLTRLGQVVKENNGEHVDPYM